MRLPPPSFSKRSVPHRCGTKAYVLATSRKSLRCGSHLLCPVLTIRDTPAKNRKRSEDAGEPASGLPAAMLLSFPFLEKNRKDSPAERALLWVWDHPEISVVQSGMSSEQQLQENCRAADLAMPGRGPSPAGSWRSRRRSKRSTGNGCGSPAPVAGTDCPARVA